MDAGKLTACAACSTLNRASASFCAACGSKLQASKDCHSCGKPNSVEARFCRHCGATNADESRECAACGVQNIKSAKFCKNCAASLEPKSQSADGLPNRAATLDGGTSSSTFSDTFKNVVESARVTFQRWYGEAEILAKERPYFAIGGAVAVVVLVGGLITGILWKNHSQPGSAGETAQADGANSYGTLYATRLAHIRNAPTSIGTVVIGDVQGGEAVSGVWVLGPDGVTRWLRIQRQDGSYGFIWGNNLSMSPQVPPIPASPISKSMGYLNQICPRALSNAQGIDRVPYVARLTTLNPEPVSTDHYQCLAEGRGITYSITVKIKCDDMGQIRCAPVMRVTKDGNVIWQALE